MAGATPLLSKAHKMLKDIFQRILCAIGVHTPQKITPAHTICAYCGKNLQNLTKRDSIWKHKK